MTREQLLEVMPLAGKRIDSFLTPLNAAMDEFEINSPERQAAFIAQIAHESEQLQWLKEIWVQHLPSRGTNRQARKRLSLGIRSPETVFVSEVVA